jgi:hypothetical protein
VALRQFEHPAHGEGVAVPPLGAERQAFRLRQLPDPALHRRDVPGGAPELAGEHLGDRDGFRRRPRIELEGAQDDVGLKPRGFDRRLDAVLADVAPRAAQVGPQIDSQSCFGRLRANREIVNGHRLSPLL